MGVGCPSADPVFSISLCHYFLLWVANPSAVLAEMKRVTRSGDMWSFWRSPIDQNRQDVPWELRKLGQLQNMALLSLGANLSMGSQRSLFEQLQLQDIHVSMLKPSSAHPSPREDEMEWQVLESDLQHLVDQGAISPEQVENFRLQDEWHRLAAPASCSSPLIWLGKGALRFLFFGFSFVFCTGHVIMRSRSGRSADRLARLHGVQEVGGQILSPRLKSVRCSVSDPIPLDMRIDLF